MLQKKPVEQINLKQSKIFKVYKILNQQKKEDYARYKKNARKLK